MDQGWIGSLLGKLAPQGLLGSGAAQQAAAILQSRPYQLHVQEARAMGQEPLTLEQFMQQPSTPYGTGLLGIGAQK
jgi:hypothetical protein